MNKHIIGKRNRIKGREFELRVRKDLEKKGWIVSKWSNQVIDNKLVQAKHKFNFFTKVMSIGTGFPDFIAYKRYKCIECSDYCGWKVVGVEAKSNSYLDKLEKTKCAWLLDNHIFQDIFIAYKGDKRGEILYKQLKGGAE